MCIRDSGYVSPDGEENYPGTLKISVKYTLTKSNALVIDNTAVSDADTVINLTNHSYFNLKGAGNGDIKDHVVQINASQYTPVDELLIPTGKLAFVTGTAFDFKTPKPVRQDMDNGKLPNGYDHNFILGDPGVMRTAAEVCEPETGRVMTVKTDKPAIQFYIGIGLDGENGKNGKKYNKYAGLCLESQFSPDTPNKPQFPTCVYKAGQTYRFTTVCLLYTSVSHSSFSFANIPALLSEIIGFSTSQSFAPSPVTPKSCCAAPFIVIISSLSVREAMTPQPCICSISAYISFWFSRARFSARLY